MKKIYRDKLEHALLGYVVTLMAALAIATVGCIASGKPYPNNIFIYTFWAMVGSQWILQFMEAK